MKKGIIILLAIAATTTFFCGCGNSNAALKSSETGEDSEVYVSNYEYVFRELPEPVYVEKADAFSGGTGTVEDPYQIATKEELALLSELVNNKETCYDYKNASYILTADIVINEGEDADNWGITPPEYAWSPIGGKTSEGSYEFNGNFDGNGHTISGLYINADASDKNLTSHPYGLFGDCYEANIKNLNIENSYICASGYSGDIGVIAGKLWKGSIENCNVEAYIEYYDAECGGIVGNNYGTISSCCFDGKITGKKDCSVSMVGGIVGYNSGDIVKCTNNAVIVSVQESGEAVGGIAGYISDAGIINCQNTGEISGGEDIGGIVGVVYSSNIGGETARNGEITLEGCQNTGTVTGINSSGIAGRISNDKGAPICIKDCKNTGMLEAVSVCSGITAVANCKEEGITFINCINEADLSGEIVGGILAKVICATGEFIVRDCTNTGVISNIEQSGLYAGGIIGELFFMSDTTSEVNISGCVNDGTIIANASAGGIIDCTVGEITVLSKNAELVISECVNSGAISTCSNNTYIGGIIGGHGAANIPTQVTDCINLGDLKVETERNLEEVLTETQGDKSFTLTNMCGGIVGRMGQTLYLTTDADNGAASNVNKENAVVSINNCYSAGNFVVPDEMEDYFVNEIGGIIGNCSETDELSFHVTECGYTNAERGLGTKQYEDVGEKMSVADIESKIR